MEANRPGTNETDTVVSSRKEHHSVHSVPRHGELAAVSHPSRIVLRMTGVDIRLEGLSLLSQTIAITNAASAD